MGARYKHIRNALGAPAAFAVAACATSTLTENITPGHVMAMGKGLAVGSITNESPYANLAALLYRKTGSGGESYFQPDRSDLIAVELPAGDYEMFSWRVTIEDGWVVAAKMFRVPFRIEPGKATYVGSYAFHIETRALNHVTSSAGNLTWAGDVACAERFEVDMRLFAARYPALPLPDTNAVPAECRANLGDGSRYHYQNLPTMDF